MDFSGKMLNSAGPSMPVQILGLETVPSPGDILNVVKNEREAQKIVDNRINERKAMASASVEDKKVSLEDFFATAQNNSEAEKKILKLIVRSDVQGSYEAIRSAVEQLGNSEVSVEVIGGGVGAITDNDVNLAASSKGFILGFNMRPVTTARRIAEEKGVDIKTYSIIYELINDVTLALEGMLTPERIEKYIGRAQVKETFSIPKVGTIAGTSVIDGKIERGCNIRLLRDGKIIYDGRLSTLKRFKDEVKEVKNGYECGMALENFNDIRSEDLIEAYVMEEKKRTLSSDLTL
jgi:translation initiation factor IF-2